MRSSSAPASPLTASPANGGGAVVNIASLGALLPLEDEPGYSATKAGVVMFTRACAALKASHNIRVNAVLPGLVDTPLLAKSGDGSTEAAWAQQARQILPASLPRRCRRRRRRHHR